MKFGFSKTQVNKPIVERRIQYFLSLYSALISIYDIKNNELFPYPSHLVTCTPPPQRKKTPATHYIQASYHHYTKRTRSSRRVQMRNGSYFFQTIWVSHAPCSDSKIQNILTCFEGFYRVFMPFGFYNPNCIGHTRNSIGWEKKVPCKIRHLGEWISFHNEKDVVHITKMFAEEEEEEEEEENTKRKMHTLTSRRLQTFPISSAT